MTHDPNDRFDRLLEKMVPPSERKKAASPQGTETCTHCQRQFAPHEGVVTAEVSICDNCNDRD